MDFIYNYYTLLYLYIIRLDTSAANVASNMDDQLERVQFLFIPAIKDNSI